VREFEKQRISKQEYLNIHLWLIRHYGKATECEDQLCEKTSETFDYALKKGCLYKRERGNFIQLCRKCHVRYDGHGQNFKNTKNIHSRKSVKNSKGYKYASISLASHQTGISRTAIINNLKGLSKSAGGLQWEYCKI